MKSSKNWKKKIDKENFHACVLDLHLNEKPWYIDEIEYTHVLKHLKGKAPVFMVTNRWKGETISQWVVNLINNPEYQVVRFYAWQDLEEIYDKKTKPNTEPLPSGDFPNPVDIDEAAQEEKIAFQWDIRTQIHLFHKFSANTQIPPKGEIRILHLANLKFQKGKEKQSNWALRRPEIFAQNILRENTSFELIIISGNITENGSPGEYLEAEIWLRNLVQAFNLMGKFVDDQFLRERLILVPGNSDINKSLAGSGRIIYNPGPTLISQDNAKYNQEYEKFGLRPFQDFAYRMTRNNLWLDPLNDLNWINNTLFLWGIQIIQLNTSTNETLSVRKDAGLSELQRDQLKLELKRLETLTNKELFTMIVAQNSFWIQNPESESKNPKQLEFDRKFNTLINELNPKLFLCQAEYPKTQQHKSTSRDFETKFKTIKTHPDPTIDQDSELQFNIITLENKRKKLKYKKGFRGRTTIDEFQNENIIWEKI